MDRRTFLRASGVAVGATATSGLLVRPAAAAPFGIVRSDRPVITHGVQSGDPSVDGVVVWARADRTAQLKVAVQTGSRRHDSLTVPGSVASIETDYTARAWLPRLPEGPLTYRVWFEPIDEPGVRGQMLTGSLVVPSRRARDIRFVWTGDNAGQGWGINLEWGGMRCWETMRRAEPQFLIHSGDMVYADGPLVPEVPLPDGTVWRNVVTPEKAKVAETLDELRGNFRYNLMDDNVRRFLADVPIIAQWDDHEVVNNWYPGELLDRDDYRVKDVDTLVRRAARAFHEYVPIGRTAESHGRVYRKLSWGPLLDVFVVDMRSFRGPNSANLQTERGPDTALLGEEQARWLVNGLRHSRAAWKVVAADMPIGLQVGDQLADGTRGWEAIANGDDGPPMGRELEIAWVLNRLRRHRVHNVVWLTADVHYCAAHHYDPARARFEGFDPFWEFVSGPVHAGTFGPNALDATFGPEVRFQKAATRPNMAPSEGYQFFGVVDIDARSAELTVSLVDLVGRTLFRQTLAPTP
jgi:alkaline phosphatase D